MSAFVGIDLGTTYSVVAHIAANGRPEVISNEFGRRITPSVVDFTDSHPVVGDTAKERQAAGSTESAAFFKREMGNSGFALPLGGRNWSPVDLSALVLGYLKEQAERALGETVSHAVITVPAYFTHLQRQDTKEAGRRAGLDVLAIINEPTAAAYAYGISPALGSRRLLVYDLGGGTFDVSLVRVEADTLEVIATAGDHQLGGRDWDDCIVAFVASEFEREHGIELTFEESQALLVEAERLKHTLTARDSGQIRVVAGGRISSYTLSRWQFEELSAPLLARTRGLCDDVVEQLSWASIDGVIPVGGSTRMPMVRELIRAMSGKAPLGGVNPDEAVALGAAIEAARQMERLGHAPLLGLPGPRHVADVVAHSLGFIVESGDGERYINKTLISKNSRVPAEVTRPVEIGVRRDAETTLDVYLTQGESDDPLDCVYLGRYVFDGFPTDIGTRATVDVTYGYDRDGLVQVGAREHSRQTKLRMRREDLPDDVPARFADRPGQGGGSAVQGQVYLAFDLSASMRNEPLAKAKEAAESFVLNLNLATTAVGLISFSDRVSVDQVATHDRDTILRAIQAMTIGRTGFGNRGQPFDELYDRLRAVDGIRFGVVLADGRWVGQRRATERAKRCHEAGIEIIAIGFGHADPDFLKSIASSDENSLFTDLDSLSATFSSIARDVQQTVELGLPSGVVARGGER